MEKSLDCNKQKRKKLRAIRKDFAEKGEEQEGVVYGAGFFTINIDDVFT